MLWKNLVKDYLTFGKRDRTGVLALVFLTAIIYFLPQYFKKSTPNLTIRQRTMLKKAIDTFVVKNTTGQPTSNEEELAQTFPYEVAPAKSFTTGELFSFDPNTLSMAGWQKLGLNERIARIINNYRSKGGKFYKPEDLKKIWGMPEGFYERVKTYITISVSTPTITTASQNQSTKRRKEKLPL
jgi:DNA uptake protein ComE-like DNA-binding protein